MTFYDSFFMTTYVPLMTTNVPFMTACDPFIITFDRLQPFYDTL